MARWVEGSPHAKRAVQALAEARRIVVLTGAGVSAESGVPTFRDKQTGLWAKYDPLELAHIDAFNRDPELVTRWYHWRFLSCKDCEPNPAHVALAELQRRVAARSMRFALLTQNIDRLHQRAGSTDVVELHGNILTWRCTRTGEQVEMKDIAFDVFPPKSRAGGLLRPNVVWFGEMLPQDALRTAYEAVAGCDVFMSVGTSSVVFPAAGFMELAMHRGATTIEINAETTPISGRVDMSLLGAAGEILPWLVAQATPGMD